MCGFRSSSSGAPAAGRRQRCGSGQRGRCATTWLFWSSSDPFCSSAPTPWTTSGGSVRGAGAAAPLAAGLLKIFAIVRAVCFYITTFAFATPLFFVMLLIYPAVMAFDKYRCVFMAPEVGCRGICAKEGERASAGWRHFARDGVGSLLPAPTPRAPVLLRRRRGEHFVNLIWAKLSTLFYYPIQVSAGLGGALALPAHSLLACLTFAGMLLYKQFEGCVAQLG